MKHGFHNPELCNAFVIHKLLFLRCGVPPFSAIGILKTLWNSHRTGLPPPVTGCEKVRFIKQT